jgi:4-hydroxyphenylpyruvate dioxygenase
MDSLPLAELCNPLGTDGFEFVEYTGLDTANITYLFESMGFRRVARHRSKNVALYRQGNINFIVNSEPTGRARRFAEEHGPSACAMAFRVRDSAAALRSAIANGATEIVGEVGPMELKIPAIEGVGGSVIYLVDRYHDRSIYDVDFVFDAPGEDYGPGSLPDRHRPFDPQCAKRSDGLLLRFLPANFQLSRASIFRHFGRIHRSHEPRLIGALWENPDSHQRIQIRRRQRSVDQIQEFIQQYRGEGIQHIALRTDNILRTWDELHSRGLQFMTPPPDTYYDMLEERLPGHGQSVEEIQKRGILIDGANGRLLLQIFTRTAIGPIFFEIIERRGDDGFGQGNFRALFVSMERDQLRRGVLKAS